MFFLWVQDCLQDFEHTFTLFTDPRCEQNEHRRETEWSHLPAQSFSIEAQRTQSWPSVPNLHSTAGLLHVSWLLFLQMYAGSIKIGLLRLSLHIFCFNEQNKLSEAQGEDWRPERVQTHPNLLTSPLSHTHVCNGVFKVTLQRRLVHDATAFDLIQVTIDSLSQTWSQQRCVQSGTQRLSRRTHLLTASCLLTQTGCSCLSYFTF